MPSRFRKFGYETSFSSTSIDAGSGIIRGVAIITEGPVLGHVDNVTGLPIRVDATTIAQVMQCASTYENGLKVKADHGSGIFAVAGYLDNFRIDGPTLRGDLHVLRSDPNYDKLFEMAATIPDTFGLSVSFSGQDEITDNTIMARCSEIYSADLVSEPAANPTGLFSKAGLDGSRKNDMAAAKDSPKPNADAPAAKGDPNNAPLPSPEDILTQCKSMMDAIAGHLSRFAALEAAVAKLNPPMPAGDPSKNSGEQPAGSASSKAEPPAVPFSMSALKEELKEFQKETIAGVAREFSALVGRSPAVAAANPAAPTDKPSDAGNLAAKAEAIVQKHFAATHSKSRALSLAANEDGAAYKALIDSGKRIEYEKKAA